jgi:predicted glutamine amidotransferase
MCRWMAYSGKTIPLELLLFRVKHNLIDQSMSARSAKMTTNGDGFGVAWYGDRDTPGLFRSIRPAWNDFNLRDLAAHIQSPLFLAHVRATSQATVQETNCHPFRFGRWLFVHNGEIAAIEKLRRDLLIDIDPEFFPFVEGSTDSELMFFLALTFGLQTDPLDALARMVGRVEAAGRRRGIEQAMWMTVGVSNGQSLWAVRYASDGDAPTLYHSRDADDIARVHPEIVERIGPAARVIVSEPIGAIADLWAPVPASTAVVVRGAEIEHRPFAPVG